MISSTIPVILSPWWDLNPGFYLDIKECLMEQEPRIYEVQPHGFHTYCGPQKVGSRRNE
jgi:hypothetical protein